MEATSMFRDGFSGGPQWNDCGPVTTVDTDDDDCLVKSLSQEPPTLR